MRLITLVGFHGFQAASVTLTPSTQQMSAWHDLLQPGLRSIGDGSATLAAMHSIRLPLTPSPHSLAAADQLSVPPLVGSLAELLSKFSD